MIWFRGQPNANYKLTPNLLRNKKEIEPENEDEKIIKKYTKEVIYKTPSFEDALSEFKRKAYGFLKQLPENDFHWMFIMQHYGAPTKLLDWTTNALVGLYFSIPEVDDSGQFRTFKGSSEENLEEFNSTGYSEGGSAVYIINPQKINSLTHGSNEIIDISEDAEKWSQYIYSENSPESSFPICVFAPYIDEMIRVQSGVFTLHGIRIEPLDWYEVLEKTMYKIFIPQESWSDLKKELKNMGMTASFIFPDLSGIAKEVRENVMEDFRTTI